MNLPRRQRDVFQAMLDGCCYKTTAQRLGISPMTVKYHQHELYQRLGVSSRGELMSRYMQPTEEAMRLLNPTPHPLAKAASPAVHGG